MSKSLFKIAGLCCTNARPEQLKMRAKYTLQNFAACLHFTLQMFMCMNLYKLLELTTTPSS
jgi:hypothetical protein